MYDLECTNYFIFLLRSMPSLWIYFSILIHLFCHGIWIVFNFVYYKKYFYGYSHIILCLQMILFLFVKNWEWNHRSNDRYIFDFIIFFRILCKMIGAFYTFINSGWEVQFFLLLLLTRLIIFTLVYTAIMTSDNMFSCAYLFSTCLPLFFFCILKVRLPQSWHGIRRWRVDLEGVVGRGGG